jgi:hypothetical protein
MGVISDEFWAAIESVMPSDGASGATDSVTIV